MWFALRGQVFRVKDRALSVPFVGGVAEVVEGETCAGSDDVEEGARLLLVFWEGDGGAEGGGADDAFGDEEVGPEGGGGFAGEFVDEGATPFGDAVDAEEASFVPGDGGGFVEVAGGDACVGEGDELTVEAQTEIGGNE